MKTNEELNRAGDVLIEEISLVSAAGFSLDIRSFLVELNIYESVFSPVMSGNMVVSDSLNLFKELKLIGEEYLIIKLRTPTFDDVDIIQKTFRVYSITDRKLVDQNTQGYILNFVSYETMKDLVNPLFKSFSGVISDVVAKIYENELSVSRTLVIDGNTVKDPDTRTPLNILNETANSVKFVSPGWSPIKCINWLCSKAIPKSGKACNFLFWETNKSFYFGNIEKIFELAKSNPHLSIGEYRHAPAGVLDVDDLNGKFFIIDSLSIPKTHDTLSSLKNGFLHNRILTLDLMNKSYKYTDYDHTKKFKEYVHSMGSDAEVIPYYTESSLRNSRNNFKFYPVQSGLYTDFKDNVNEKMVDIFGNRLSNMLELRNFKLEINIPGRTDVEVGSLINVDLTDTSPVDDSDFTNNKRDELYSGRHLITKIHHKINPARHSMIMEIVKDSLTNYVGVY